MRSGWKLIKIHLVGRDLLTQNKQLLFNTIVYNEVVIKKRFLVCEETLLMVC